jgi:elongation factor Tu
VLVATLDKDIPVPVHDIQKPFFRVVENAFFITGCGTVATGKIERGCMKVGEEVKIESLVETRKTKPDTRVKTEVCVLTKDERAQHPPFVNGQRPTFILGTTDVAGVLLCQKAVKWCCRDNLSVDVERQKPIAMEKGQTLAIREG